MFILSDPLVMLPSACGLALLLFAAAWHKFMQPAAFAAALGDYGVQPGGLQAFAVRALPLMEAALACGLLLSVTRSACAVATGALLLAYGGAMLSTLWQGRRIADCGCGGTKTPVGMALVWRNAVLALIALNLTQTAVVRPLGVYDIAALAFITLMGCMLYVLANTLIAATYRTRILFHA